MGARDVKRGNKDHEAGSVNHGGFSLIELLVVIAIIAVLASLLLPALKTAREDARASQCMSNLKEVGRALLMYADDYNQTFPPFWTTPGNTIWQYLIGTTYLNEPPWPGYGQPDVILRSTMHCPMDNSQYPNWGYVRCVAINGTMYPDLVFGDVAWPGPNGVTNRRLSQIRYPSELCLIGDGASGYYSDEWGCSARYLFNGTWNDLTAMCRHRNGMNFVFVDGHAEWKPRAWVLNEALHMWSWSPPVSRFFDWSCVYQ